MLAARRHHSNERSNLAGTASAGADPSKRALSSFLPVTRSSAGRTHHGRALRARMGGRRAHARR